MVAIYLQSGVVNLLYQPVIKTRILMTSYNMKDS